MTDIVGSRRYNSGTAYYKTVCEKAEPLLSSFAKANEAVVQIAHWYTVVIKECK